MSLLLHFCTCEKIKLLLTFCRPAVDAVINIIYFAVSSIAGTPSQPENVRLSMTSSGHVLVAWDAPSINSNLVEFYRVDYTAERADQIQKNSSRVGSPEISEGTNTVWIYTCLLPR